MKTATRMDLCNCFAARQAARHLTRFYERELADAHLHASVDHFNNEIRLVPIEEGRFEHERR